MNAEEEIGAVDVVVVVVASRHRRRFIEDMISFSAGDDDVRTSSLDGDGGDIIAA